MLIKTYAAALQSIHAATVTIEVNITRGSWFQLVGLPDTAVRESHERIKSAIETSGYRFTDENVIVNMSPADLRKEGAAYDLPLAIGILAASEQLPGEGLSHMMLMGELGLDGTLKPIKGALPIALLARKEGYRYLIVPRANAQEAAVVNKLKVYAADSLKDVCRFVSEGEGLELVEVDTRKEFYKGQRKYDIDFADVRGQAHVKRALEVAAAGGHNVLMVGSPGSGKSMMAKRIPSILPPLNLSESLETTMIYSVSGKLEANTTLMTMRPFRAPHHTISPVALVGGGSNPQPGEISLAHNGVLFLDELAEYNRAVLEVMRQPLEDRNITIARAKYTVEYPASFMLVAAMNPCPCGYYNHPSRECSCSPHAIQRYSGRISGPLLDRIDIQVEIVPVPFEEISNNQPAETSENIRDRVLNARKRQEERFEKIPDTYCNAQMSSSQVRKYVQLDSESLQKLKLVMERFGLSARAYDRILRVARTIADLENSNEVKSAHIAEAIGYRNLDRSNWGQ